MKKCSLCDNLIEDNEIICDSCKSINQNMEVLQQQNVTNEEDTQFRIIYDVNNLKLSRVYIENLSHVAVFFFLLFISFSFLSFFILIPEILNNHSNTGIMVIIFKTFFILTIAVNLIGCLVILIKILRRKTKVKTILQNGMVLKNLEFKIIRRNPWFTKIQAGYNSHVFVGRLLTQSVSKREVCDVLVDQNNYENYVIWQTYIK